MGGITILHVGRYVLCGICLIITILQQSGLGRGMCSTECHSSLFQHLLHNVVTLAIFNVDHYWYSLWMCKGT